MKYTQSNGVTVTEVTTPAVYTGRGEFYSGIATGDPVTLLTTTYSGGPLAHPRTHYAVSKGGAWLALYDLDCVTTERDTD